MELIEQQQLNEPEVEEVEPVIATVEPEVLESIESFMKIEKPVVLRKIEQTPKTDKHKIKHIKFPDPAEHSPIQSVLNF